MDNAQRNIGVVRKDRFHDRTMAYNQNIVVLASGTVGADDGFDGPYPALLNLMRLLSAFDLE